MNLWLHGHILDTATKNGPERGPSRPAAATNATSASNLHLRPSHSHALRATTSRAPFHCSVLLPVYYWLSLTINLFVSYAR
jgi:hypothetical protein